MNRKRKLFYIPIAIIFFPFIILSIFFSLIVTLFGWISDNIQKDEYVKFIDIYREVKGNN